MFKVIHEFGNMIHSGTEDECIMVLNALNVAGLNGTDKYSIVKGEEEEPFPPESFCNCPACPGGIQH
jgi:hypothetical protein